MKKVKVVFRRGISLLLIIVLCFNSFAAIVSDNDGSAFITKAEFDSLKNSFQSQIDQYNTSVDAKIDGAIAAYLAGIRMSKKTEVPIVVSNYDDMKWMRKFMVYGPYVDHTSNTNRTVYNDVWYEPKFQKGIPQRNPSGINNVFALSRFFGANIISMNFNYNITDATGVSMWNSDFAVASGAPLPLYLNCKYTESDDDDIVLTGDEPFSLLICYDSYNGVNMKVGGGMGWLYNKSSGTWSDSSRLTEQVTVVKEGDTYFPDAIEVLEPETEDTVINFWVYGNRTNRDEYYRTGGSWRLTEFNPMNVQLTSTSSTKALDQINLSWGGSVAPDSFLINGGHLYGQAFGPGQNKNFNYVMAGTDWNQDANILRLSSLKAGRTNQRKTTYATWASFPIKITWVQLSSNYSFTTDKDTYNGRNVDVQVDNYRLPYLETYPIKKITSGKFMNGQSNIKIGEGLPISTYLNGKGTLTISFDYDIGRTAETVPSGEDKRIKVDVKKTNFLSETNDYYSGIVDGGTTTVTLKDAASGSNTSQKSKIVIENVKEGDEVWIRIAPYSTTSGLYAQMSNLNASVETED